MGTDSLFLTSRSSGARRRALKVAAACGLCGLLAIAGCKTVDHRVAGAITGIAAGKSPEALLREGLKTRATVWVRNPQVLAADLRALKRDFQRLEAFLTGKASGPWGRKEARLPGRTQYVKYTQSYQSRAVVDFDAGEITVETVDARDPRTSLREAIVTTLLTPDDPRAVDLYSDKPIELTGARAPYLFGLVHDHRGRAVATPQEAEAFAEELLAKRAASRTVADKTALYVKFAMVENFSHRQAEKYRPLVEKYAARYKLSPSLVFAIIRTESNFNPFAVSPAPAYGMMQLVPASGGREALRHLTGRDEMPTREDLFDAERNIELGSAYLHVLFGRELDYVEHPVSREYCVISAYNTGPGNVLRTFARDRVAAVNAINRLEPPAVYERLRRHLPYEETRHYLVKVTSFRRQFLRFGD